jgi:hypothetical protein
MQSTNCEDDTDEHDFQDLKQIFSDYLGNLRLSGKSASNYLSANSGYPYSK